jgi:hypothetical protein
MKNLEDFTAAVFSSDDINKTICEELQLYAEELNRRVSDADKDDSMGGLDFLELQAKITLELNDLWNQNTKNFPPLKDSFKTAIKKLYTQADAPPLVKETFENL